MFTLIRIYCYLNIALCSPLICSKLCECTYNKYLFLDLQCCVHAVLEFVSPENVAECIQLIDEVRRLPEDHKAKVDKLEVISLTILFTISHYSCSCI